MSGKTLKKKFKKIKPVIVSTTNDIDTLTRDLQRDGIYFIDNLNIMQYMHKCKYDDRLKYIAIVEIHDDSQILIYNKNFKSSMITINKIVPITEYFASLTEHEKFEIAKHNINAFDYIESPSKNSLYNFFDKNRNHKYAYKYSEKEKRRQKIEKIVRNLINAKNEKRRQKIEKIVRDLINAKNGYENDNSQTEHNNEHLSVLSKQEIKNNNRCMDYTLNKILLMILFSSICWS